MRPLFGSSRSRRASCKRRNRDQRSKRSGPFGVLSSDYCRIPLLPVRCPHARPSNNPAFLLRPAQGGVFFVSPQIFTGQKKAAPPLKAIHFWVSWRAAVTDRSLTPAGSLTWTYEDAIIAVKPLNQSGTNLVKIKFVHPEPSWPRSLQTPSLRFFVTNNLERATAGLQSSRCSRQEIANLQTEIKRDQENSLITHGLITCL